jgi:hypothetical protein
MMRAVRNGATPSADTTKDARGLAAIYEKWRKLREDIESRAKDPLLQQKLKNLLDPIEDGFARLFEAQTKVEIADQVLKNSRQPLDHKKFLDMLIDEVQDNYIELLEGTRAHIANIDNYIKRITTALDDDFNTQFYLPAFREVRTASRLWDVNLGQIETTSVLANNRSFAKVSPQATMEFDLPKRDILINEAFNSSKALMDDYGALLQDPTFLALAKLNSGMPTSSPAGATGNSSPVRNVLPGLPSQSDERLLGQQGPGNRQFGAALEALIPDPAVYKFETGTGYEIRPVIQPDGQAVVFHFNYMYTTNVREPVRADEKHLGRVKQHFIDTDVQLSNFELREVSRYQVALKASRTARGVPLLEDAPGIGVLFRPLPQAESSLQENLILAQTTIFPTLFDLMGLRWAPVVADLDALRLVNDDFIVRGRRRDLENRVYDISSSRVDDFMRVPQGERRTDLYRSQETIPAVHPDGYRGPGLNLQDSHLQEGYNPNQVYPESQSVPGTSADGVQSLQGPDIGRQPSAGQETPPGIDGARRKRGRARIAPQSILPARGETFEPAPARPREPKKLNPHPNTTRSKPRGNAKMIVPTQGRRAAVQPKPIEVVPAKPARKGFDLFAPFRRGKGD